MSRKTTKSSAPAAPDAQETPVKVIQLVGSAKIAGRLYRPGAEFTELPDGIADELLASGAAVVAYAEAAAATPAEAGDGDADDTNPSETTDGGAEGETA